MLNSEKKALESFITSNKLPLYQVVRFTQDTSDYNSDFVFYTRLRQRLYFATDDYVFFIFPKSQRGDFGHDPVLCGFNNRRTMERFNNQNFRRANFFLENFYISVRDRRSSVGGMFSLFCEKTPIVFKNRKKISVD